MGLHRHRALGGDELSSGGFVIPTELPPAAVGSPGPGLDPFPPPPPHLGMEESGGLELLRVCPSG